MRLAGDHGMEMGGMAMPMQPGGHEPAAHDHH
jgi:hypothetical protein